MTRVQANLLAFGVAVVLGAAGFYWLMSCWCTYTPRAMVSESLSLAGGAKMAVQEYYREEKRFPADNEEAGLSLAERISGKYARSLTVNNGVIRVLIGGPEAHKRVRDRELVLTPMVSGDLVEWRCDASAFEGRDQPSSCR